MSTKSPIRFWTKEEIVTLLDLWENTTLADMARKLNRREASINQKANEIRKAGHNLPKKASAGGAAKALLMDVLRERNLIS